MKVVYVAGPFTADTAWDREQNVRRAEDVGKLIAEAGAMPLIPHANTRFFEGLNTPEFWYEGTLELLRRCDAIALVEGWESSKGTLAEVKEAEKLNMTIFGENEMSDLLVWIMKTQK